ncbi:WYL domain-containing protein [Actinomycetaceae bacterium L2_0104]
MSETAAEGGLHTPNERQLTLLEFIMSRHGVSKSDIRGQLPVYGGRTDAAFERLLERDLDSLRRAGYPLVSGDDHTYHLDRNAGLHPNVSALDISLLRALLAGVTTRGPLYLAANNGLHKLLATSPSQQGRTQFLQANIPAGDEALRLARALQNRQRVRFEYRGTTNTGPTAYLLEPCQLEEHFDVYYVSGPAKRLGESHRGGRWEERRTFRTTRIVAGSLSVVASAQRPRPKEQTRSVFTVDEAMLAIRPGCALPLVARGAPCESCPGAPEGWECFRYRHVNRQKLFEELATYGLDVRLLGDEALVTEWRMRLRHLASLGPLSARVRQALGEKEEPVLRGEVDE